MRASARLALALVMLLALSGCGAGDPIARWQTQVSDFINKENNGDLNAVRHYAEPAHQREFGMYGASEGGIGLISPTRTDTTGVLLGRAVVNDDAWFVFLVGVVSYKGSMTYFPLDEARVQDIRLAAMRAAPNGKLIWRLTDASDEQLDRYLAVQREAWANRYASSAQPAGEAITTFPTERDSFEMEVNALAQTITARERTSGASWTLQLTDAHQLQQPTPKNP